MDDLDWSNYTTAVNITLTGTGTDGFAGTQSTINGGFTNIDWITGSITGDTLYGLNSNATWHFDTTDTYINDHTLTFIRYEILMGGTGVDTFAFIGTATFEGTLNGGDGSDILNTTAYLPNVTVNLAAGTITGLIGGILIGLSFWWSVRHKKAEDALSGAD